MAKGESTYDCGACVKQLRYVRDENTPVGSLRSAATSEIGKTVSPDGELILPPLEDNDSLSVQLETVRLNGVCTSNMIETLIEMSLKLFEEAAYLHKVMQF
jgi:hypothetical protein